MNSQDTDTFPKDTKSTINTVPPPSRLLVVFHTDIFQAPHKIKVTQLTQASKAGTVLGSHPILSNHETSVLHRSQN